MKKPHPKEPSILRSNLKFMSPGFTHTQRNTSQKQKINIVSNYLTWLNFNILVGVDSVKGVHPAGIKVVFTYKETEKTIYKQFSIFNKDGSKSNINLLRKLYKK